jgi:SagB-type dehydrogenase family enzyme
MTLSGKHYHQLTSYERGSLGGRGMDWSNQPDLFKTYPGIDALVLPRPQDAPETDLLALCQAPWPDPVHKPLNLDQLSAILSQAYSLTARARTPGGMFYYRSVASAGALYPTELYLAVNTVARLDPGLYHYRIKDSTLAPLRTLDPTPAFKGLLLGASPPGDISLAFLVTGIFFRSAWKYGKRAYRYVLLDAGHLAASLLLALKAAGINAQTNYTFDDGKASHLLGLGIDKEACLAAITIGGASPSQDTQTTVEALPSSFTDCSRVSPQEPAQDLINRIHVAGAPIDLPDEATLDMARCLQTPAPDKLTPAPSPAKQAPVLYPRCVWSRRSKRNFIKTPIAHDDFGYLMKLVHAFYRNDTVTHGRASATMATGLLIRQVDQWPQGYYGYDALQNRLGCIKEGAFTDAMTDACLNQAWLANAAVHFLLIADLEQLDHRWGPRGYRYLMLNAGRLGQKIYLGAAALGLGCCGIGAIYDAEAAAILDLNQSTALCYLVAVGAVKRL